MDLENNNIILHAMKSVALSHKREAEYRNDVLDEMFADLGVLRPERRVNGERRNGTRDN
jgi:hypothetical protein